MTLRFEHARAHTHTHTHTHTQNRRLKTCRTLSPRVHGPMHPCVLGGDGNTGQKQHRWCTHVF